MQIKTLNKTYGIEILYATKVGSHLYGTNSESSDEDYFGIFLPKKEAMLLGRVDHVINLDTNKANTKNTSEDIDCKLISIQHWLSLILKGETNALDILYSMFREDTIVFANKIFTDYCKTNYRKFISKNSKAYIGYATAQASKYGLKTIRYREVVETLEIVSNLPSGKKVSEYIQHLSEATAELNYVNVIRAAGPRKTSDINYLEVLGKRYSEQITIEQLLAKLAEKEAQYGNRAKHSGTGVEWKSLSHALRVVHQLEMLLKDSFIQFPLPDASYILKVKQGLIP